MTGAIWALAYEISNDDRETYLDWFHRIHIPEKLARPGYRWAAILKAAPPRQTPIAILRYLAALQPVYFLTPVPRS